MIPLLLLGLAAINAADLSDENRGQWSVLSENGTLCIKMYAQIDLKLSYVKDDDSLAEAGIIMVPVDATTENSSCYEKVQVGEDIVDSQVLQLNFPNNEGWNVRIYYTEDARLDVDPGDYALYQVTVTANYSSMPDVFKDTPKGHTHTYYSVIDFTDPPFIANDEYTKVGDCLYCPDSQAYIINEDPHHGPPASVSLTNLQMQAYMTGDDFGKIVTCAEDENELDLVPVIVSCILAGLVLFTLVAYFVYRARLPIDILNITEQEFEEDEYELHHEKQQLHENGQGQINNGFHEQEQRY